ncbi:TPA: hypothetical protein HA336_05765 [Methanopyrus kandleri]|uniref:2-phosphosulfolactate phosphatase n=2 Tax=Methanopyrus kandleri TaxID=2320 RepID=Q8TZ03_METKA|nr:2-phosphosulfolactate phosphatase [Methanopyrus kandleri AV19]HII70722.1 hypothetical protein [Methanopyrus kandleri]
MRVASGLEPQEGYEIGVVVDALRASSTIVTALALEAEAIVPLSSPEELKRVDGPTIGEQHGKKIDFADYGNSPTDLLRHAEEIEGETLYMVTTNGTDTILRAAEVHEEVLIGSLLNASAVASKLSGDTCFVEAGHRGMLAVEDTYTAGYIARLAGGEPADGRTRAAMEMARGLPAEEVFKGSRTGHVLEQRGRLEDVEFCARVDEFEVVPVYEDGMVVPQ